MNEVLQVKDLKIYFPVRQSLMESIWGKQKKYIHAVDGIDFSVKNAEIVALVGESGCGKTTTGKAVLQLVDAGILQGKVIFEGKDLSKMDKLEKRLFRQRAQMIFQDPYQSLNPKDTIYDIVAEPLLVNRLTHSESECSERVEKALENAGLKPAGEYLGRYPHELSGGQRQRVAIAGALVLKPRFIVADEPVSMLDVSVRADILKLIVKLRDEQGISCLFITHDISLAWVISDRIAIMYLGKIMEIGPTDEVVKRPVHPYSKALLDVMPKPEPRRGKKRELLPGEVPNPIELPSGCRFHPRCPLANEKCRIEEPKPKQAGEEHFVACHYV